MPSGYRSVTRRHHPIANPCAEIPMDEDTAEVPAPARNSNDMDPQRWQIIDSRGAYRHVKQLSTGHTKWLYVYCCVRDAIADAFYDADPHFCPAPPAEEDLPF